MAKNTRKRTRKSGKREKIEKIEKIEKSIKIEKEEIEKPVKISYLEKLLNPKIPTISKAIIEAPKEKKIEESFVIIPTVITRNKDYEFWLYSNQDDLYDTYLKFINSEDLFNDFCYHAYFTRDSDRYLLPSETIKAGSCILLNQMQEYAFDRGYNFFESIEIPKFVGSNYLNFLYDPDEFRENEEQWILV